MSGIIGQVGAKSGIISGSSATSAGTVTLSGITGLDYEEGTFDIAVSGASASATMHSGYKTLSYTKVGKMITFLGHIVVTNENGMGASVKVTGFPFVNGAHAGLRRTPVNIGGYTELSLDVAGYSLTGSIFESASIMYIYEYGITSGTRALAGADWGAGQAHLCGTYFID